MADTTNGTAASVDWSESLTKSEGQLAAGETVSGAAVRQRLRESIARLEAKQGDAQMVEAAPRR